MSLEDVYQEILKLQQIEYALCDKTNRVYDYSPGLAKLTNNPHHSPAGQLLDTLFDELAGNEDSLQQIKESETENLKFEKVLRISPDGCERYLTIQVSAFVDGLLVLVTDVTPEGLLEQRITQQRNELHLLAHELADTQLRLDNLLRRYMPSKVADELIANPNAIGPGGEKKYVTILFADLRGFTRWMEEKQEDVTDDGLAILNSKLALAAEAILEYQGTLDKYLGDAVMGIFNAPQPDEDHTFHAVKAAWQFTQALQQENDLQFSVGINAGLTTVGNIGIPQAMNYTAIGDPVNQAKRLQEMAKPGQILISQAVLDLLPDTIDTRPLGKHTLRGKEKAIEIFEVVGV